MPELIKQKCRNPDATQPKSCGPNLGFNEVFFFLDGSLQ